MKKIRVTALLILTASIILSFTIRNNNEDEVMILVTSDKSAKFDMFQSTDSPHVIKATKGLTTPYELKINSGEGRFIFRSVKSRSSIKMSVARGDNKAFLHADWPVIVLVIHNGTYETFGLD